MPLAPSLDDALALARRAHGDQKRYGGAPYITHVQRVVDACAEHGEDAEIVAALHDIVEDTDITFRDLLNFGYPYHIVTAVDAISRRVCSGCDGYGTVLADTTWLRFFASMPGVKTAASKRSRSTRSRCSPSRTSVTRSVSSAVEVMRAWSRAPITSRA